MLKSKLLQSLLNKIQKLRVGFFLRVLVCSSLLVSTVGTNTSWAKTEKQQPQNNNGNNSTTTNTDKDNKGADGEGEGTEDKEEAEEEETEEDIKTKEDKEETEEETEEDIKTKEDKEEDSKTDSSNKDSNKDNNEDKDTPKKAKANGYLANVIRSGGSENDSKEIFARINNKTKEGKSGVWGQARVARTKYSGDDNSLGGYTDNEKGGFIGYDKYIAQEKLPGKLMLGVYTKANEHCASQGSTDKGNITNAGAGVYSSYEEEKWGVKAIISGSYDMYNNNEREISIPNVDKKIVVKAKDFTGYGVGCNLEGALKVKLSDTFNLRPYLGLDARISHYNSIKEKNLDKELAVNTESGRYNRTFAKTGLVLEQKIGKFGWNVNAEYKRLLSSNLPKVVSAYTYKETEGEVVDIGREEGRNVLGAGVGGNYNITENVSIFANINILTAKGYQNEKANLGVSCRFGRKILKAKT